MLTAKSKILIIDECHQAFLEILDGKELHYRPDIELAELEEIIDHYEVLILRSKLNLDKKWLDRAKRLKLIGRLGSGLDNIDVDYAQTKGILCLNAPEGNRAAVAEQSIGMLLSLLSNIHKSSLEVKENIWNRKGNSGTELSACTVGIIGYGNVGSALAGRLQAFGCRILAYDLYKTDFSSETVEEVSLEELQKRANVISLHVPLNEHSMSMLDAEFIAKVQRPFYLLNLSRGQVVDSNALKTGLEEGKILGLGMDVFEEE